MDNDKLKYNGKFFKIIDHIPYGMNHNKSDEDYDSYLECKLNVADEDGKKHVAEFRISHAQATMLCNNEEHYEFMKNKMIPSRFINKHNLYDII